LNTPVQGAFDLAVVGSGFAGSLLAMIGRRLGRSVVLLEKGKHPRFAIGESSTPLANLILEELADRYALPGVRALTKWGTWQKSHPDVACGLKRGFTFYHQKAGFHFSDDATHRAQLLVAASPNDFVADTHWYRPDFDAMMVREAQAMGVVYLDETELWGVDIDQKRPVIQGRRGGRPLELHVAFIADASGPRGFLHRALDLPELPFRNLPPTQALYSHFIGVKKWSELQPPDAQPPYPIDDAALHHVFDGGWIWVLRFNNGITSAGVAATDEGRSVLSSLDFTQGEESWKRLLKRFPSIEAQFSEARAVQPFTHARRLSFLSGEVAGRNWALLPSAAGFVDPLLSTGFPLTLLGIERLAEILQRNSEGDKLHAELCHYSMQTTAELVAVERLVAALYATMHDFELFAALTMVYFAAASFTESVRRLGKPELAGRTFLLGERPGFGPAFRSCVDLAMRRPEGRERSELLAKIQRAIDPINIAGLGVEERRRWYPALASDLLAGAAKLESTPGEVQAMLRRCGLG
jgi:FADH2 O2-dependent halogenase